MSLAKIPKYFRIDPVAVVERTGDHGESTIEGPSDFIGSLRPKYGIVEAS